MNNIKNQLSILWIDIKLIAINVAIEILEALIPLHKKLMEYKEGINNLNNTDDE